MRVQHLPQWQRTKPATRARVPYRHNEEAEWRRAAWTIFWLVVIGKLLIMIALATVALISLHPSRRSWTVVALLNWTWILLAAIMVTGPALYWFRLRRVRRKRAALIHAEWNVD